MQGSVRKSLRSKRQVTRTESLKPFGEKTHKSSNPSSCRIPGPRVIRSRNTAPKLATITEGRLGQAELHPTNQPHERRHSRSLEIGMHDDDAVARDQPRHTARDLERDLPIVQRASHRVAHNLKPLQPLRLTSGELREAHLLDVVDDLLSEQLDGAQSRQCCLAVLGRITEDQRGNDVAGGRRERQHMGPANTSLRPAMAKIAQREHLVRLHAHGDAPRTFVVAFANRDPHAAVADGVNGVHEDAKPLVQRRGALDVDQRSVQREIVIPVT